MISIISFFSFFVFMEFVAWFAHKFIMHGFLWSLHEDHHNQPKGFVQKNDSFFLLFAIPSWLLIMTGMIDEFDWKMWAGFGIAAYGLVYFLIHEVLIHRRFKLIRKLLFSGDKNYYFRALEYAHRQHHKHLSKKDGESFGLLIFSKKYYNSVK